jgi:hypothetical protein
MCELSYWKNGEESSRVVKFYYPEAYKASVFGENATMIDRYRNTYARY